MRCSLQKHGIEFGDTFSSIAKSTFLKALISFVVTRGQHLRQMEVKNALISVDFDRGIYMTHPVILWIHPKFI